MGRSEKTQHAIRRSTRLPLEVPVLVTSLDPAQPFSEPGNTTLVNAHGCGLILPRALASGIPVRLEIVSTKRHTTAHVSDVVPLGGDPETWLVGLELDVPGNFWGIDYAPSDWKIDEPKVEEQKVGEQMVGEQKFDDGPSPAAEQPRLDPEPAAKSARSHLRPHRWRLTDISAGACYLEAAAPFPADTSVLLSVRVLDTECLLEGVVRVSHAQTGMGVEFTRAQGHDQRARVAELIGHLMDSHEVPRIFVGWKEDRKEGRKEGKFAPENQAPPAARDAESPDPLLELIHIGASLTAEEFLKALRAQRHAVE